MRADQPQLDGHIGQQRDGFEQRRHALGDRGMPDKQHAQRPLARKRRGYVRVAGRPPVSGSNGSAARRSFSAGIPARISASRDQLEFTTIQSASRHSSRQASKYSGGGASGAPPYSGALPRVAARCESARPRIDSGRARSSNRVDFACVNTSRAE